jgi:hypothetical protein
MGSVYGRGQNIQHTSDAPVNCSGQSPGGSGVNAQTSRTGCYEHLSLLGASTSKAAGNSLASGARIYID